MRLRDGRTNRVPERHATASHVLLPGLRFTDPHIRNEILPATSQRYKKCVSLFMSFCILYKLHFAAVDELDDLLAERKNTASPSKSEFEGVVAGIKHVLPGAKGGLPWSHSIVSAWGVCHELEHTKPMTEGPAVYIGCQMSARGHGRLGAGVILQHSTTSSNKLVWKDRGQHPMNWRASVLQWHRSTDGVNRAALGNVSSMWLDFVPHQEYKTT